MATGSFYSYFGSKAEIFAAVVRAINTDLRQAMKAALEHTEGGQRARERASFRAYFDMLSQRPWIDRIVRESEFIDPGLFREYYEHLARVTRAACGPPRWPTRWTRATIPRSSRSPIPASATSSACAGPTGRPAAGSPRTCWTTCSSSWPEGWPRVTRRGIRPRLTKHTGVDNPVEGVLTMLCAWGNSAADSVDS